MISPNFTVSLLTPEEAPLYQAIRHETFRPTMNKAFYPKTKGEPSQKTQDRVIADIQDGIINKGIFYLKCVDNSTGQIIAGARWRHIRPKDLSAALRTDDEVDEGLSVPEPYEESDPELYRALFDQFNSAKKRILGNKPYFALDTLVTHPDHHRRGAGGLLVDWGVKRADEAGVQCYLEASPMGAPLYARFGFEPLEEMELGLRGFWGEEKALNFILMGRPAKGERS